MIEMKTGRRPFMLKTCAIMAGALVGPAVIGTAVGAAAEERHDTMFGHGGSDGYIIDASAKGHCGTCEFWADRAASRKMAKASLSLVSAGAIIPNALATKECQVPITSAMVHGRSGVSWDYVLSDSVI